MIFEDDQGLCIWPDELIASLTPAYPQRLRVVTHDGTVGYLPGSFPEGPWQPLGQSRVHPNWLQRVEDQLEDPARFRYPGANLTPRPPWQAPPYWGQSGDSWLADHDQTAPCPQPPSDWLPVNKTLQVNPLRVRRLLAEAHGVLKLLLDNGQKIKVTPKSEAELLRRLGLCEARHLQPHQPALFRVFLREYPFEIAFASAAVLRSHFRADRELISQVIWQALSYHQLGIKNGYNKSHRGFWYNPLEATLARAGVWTEASELLYAQIIGQYVGTDRLFCYQDLGFEDVYQHLREIGSRRPDIILFIEKDSLSEVGKQVARNLGISWIISGGMSHLGAVEFFCAALRLIYQGPVSLLVYGDFDPGGHVAGHSCARHLERYQVACPAGAQFVITPQLYSAEELELFARPLSAKNDRVDGWLAATGGIHGEPKGIHADWLQPAERVYEAVKALVEAVRGR